MPETHADDFVPRLVEFARGDSESVLIIPENLSDLSQEELTSLHEQVTDHFDAVYGDGSALSQDDLTTLSDLTNGIETLVSEQSKRAEAQAERTAKAAQLAARAGFAKTPEEEEEDAEAEPGEGGVPAAPAVDAAGNPIPVEDEEEEEAKRRAVVAPMSSRKEIRVNLAALSGRQKPRRTPTTARTMKDIVRAADVPGFSRGEGLDWTGVGKAVDRRLNSFNQAQFEEAQRNGTHIREQYGIAVINKPFDPDLVIRSSDPEHVEEVMRRAADEHRLPGGSLVASGGWCAPSETIYDLFEIESRDGLFSVPEVSVARGGINFTPGPDFATIYAGAPGWNYTEANDIGGKYAVDAGGIGTNQTGNKPVYKVPCPAFSEKRLDVRGMAVTAGLLQSRGYPEVIARTVRGVLVAHDHRQAGLLVAALEAGSTAVAMTIDQVGSAAPLLDAVELQVEHYRYVHRLGRATTLEAVFPYWVHGAVRSDLSRRSGVDMLNVTDAQIDAWFAARGVAPQYIYNWQDLTGAAGSFKAWPSSVKFLLYVAGTWVKGTSDIIILDTVYDSVMLGSNDFTALWTEEGWLAAKMGHDSRVVTVPLCPSGGTGSPQVIACSGTSSGPTPGTLASSAILATSFMLTVTGASDPQGLDAAPYRFSTDGGATWTTWQAAANRSMTGLVTATQYQCRHEVRDAAGNRTAGTIIAVTTA